MEPTEAVKPAGYTVPVRDLRGREHRIEVTPWHVGGYRGAICITHGLAGRCPTFVPADAADAAEDVIAKRVAIAAVGACNHVMSLPFASAKEVAPTEGLPVTNQVRMVKRPRP